MTQRPVIPPEHEKIIRDSWPDRNLSLRDIGIMIGMSREAVGLRARMLGLPERAPIGRSRLPTPDLSPKLCKVCGILFGKRERESPSHFRNRATCGPYCAKKYIGNQQRGIEKAPADVSSWTRLKQPWPADLWYGDHDLQPFRRP